MHREIKGSLFFFFPEFSNGLYLKKKTSTNCAEQKQPLFVVCTAR